MAVTSMEEMARKAQKKAEESFKAGNVFAAKQWMQSALRLAPDFPGNAQAVAAYDVHAAATRSPRDWYAVLGLRTTDPHSPASAARSSASGSPLVVVITHDVVKKQYRKLCLLVHPDKNATARAAADGAFKLVQDAWDVLSARHPPGSAAVTIAASHRAPSSRPPDPPPRHPSVVVQMQRTSRTTQQQEPRRREPTTRSQPPPPPPARPSPPVAGDCPACGASTTTSSNNGLMSKFRCMSCKWGPMDQRRDDYDYDYDDLDDEDYY